MNQEQHVFQCSSYLEWLDEAQLSHNEFFFFQFLFTLHFNDEPFNLTWSSSFFKALPPPPPPNVCFAFLPFSFFLPVVQSWNNGRSINVGRNQHRVSESVTGFKGRGVDGVSRRQMDRRRRTWFSADATRSWPSRISPKSASRLRFAIRHWGAPYRVRS